MVKHLLSLLIIFCFGFVNSQNPSGCKIIQTPMINYSEVQPQNNISVNPILINHKKNISNTKTNAVATVTVTRFTGSMNVFGVLISESNSLCYNPGPNIISFVHRKSPTYTPAANGNSGSIVTMYSNNLGAGWDSTCIWANSTDLARYPQGGIYNPLGNTTYTNAYAVGMGPILSGTVFAGNFYTSKKLTAVGNTTPGIDQQSLLNASLPVGVKTHHYSRNSFSSIDGSYVRSMSSILNDPAGATNVAYGARGAMTTKGLFTAGSFSWTTDSFVPPITLRTDGSKQINANAPLCVWSPTPSIGYIVMYGCRAGAPMAQRGYQPIVYKTTTGGASWVLLPSNDFTTPNFQGLKCRLKPINTNNTIIIPQFSTQEGYDATVDVNGNLHIVTTVVSSYSSHQDSLDYGYQFAIGGNNYNYDYTPYIGKPTIYDFYTMSGGGWDYFIIDTMATEGTPTTAGPGPGVWSDGGIGKLGTNARIQLSRTTDGKKLYYSWTTSDPAIAGNNYNAYPNIRVKGFDVVSNKVTTTYSVTDGSICPGFTGVDALAYWHFMSDLAIGSSTTCVELPFTASNNATNNGNIAVDHYYLKGQTICATAFSINPIFFNPCFGVGIQSNSIPKSGLSISPNPSDGLFTVGNLQNESVIEVFDITGRLILKEIISENSAQIDLSDKQKGIYFYRVIDKNNNAQQGKLIVE